VQTAKTMKRRRRITASAAEAGADRDLFIQFDSQAGLYPVMLHECPRRPGDQIVLTQGQGLSPRHNPDPVPDRPQPQAQSILKINHLHQRNDFMVSGGLTLQDIQQEINLGRCVYGYGRSCAHARGVIQ